MGKNLFIFKSNADIVAGSLNSNFRYLYDYLSAIASDDVLLNRLAQSPVLATNVATAMSQYGSTFMNNIASMLQTDPTFFSSLSDAFLADPLFMPSIVATMAEDYSFTSSIANSLAESDSDFDNNVSDLLANDTRGVNTRLDISSFDPGDGITPININLASGSLGGKINYLSTDNGTVRTKKSDEVSVTAPDYATNSIYEIDGSYWVVEVQADGTTFKIYRYDTKAEYDLQHASSKANYLAGPDGFVGSVYSTIQIIGLGTCLNKNSIQKDLTTGRIYYYGESGMVESSSLGPSFRFVNSVSFRIIDANPNEVFFFKTYASGTEDNGFIANMAHAISGNDALVYEIGKRVISNPGFVEQIAQNVQKVYIDIETEFMGNGSAVGEYIDNVMETTGNPSTLVDDYTQRFILTPRLMDKSLVAENFLISQIKVLPYIDTQLSNNMLDSTNGTHGIDATDGVYLTLFNTAAVAVGQAVKTNLGEASQVAYIRAIGSNAGSQIIYLTNDPISMPIVSSWSQLGWVTTNFVGNAGATPTEIIFPYTIDIDPDFDVVIFDKNDFSETAYEAYGNIYQLDDIRNFWYYTNDIGKLFLEIHNNIAEGRGNINKYMVRIYGYRLVDYDITLSPANRVEGESLTDQVDGANLEFNIDFPFVINSTSLFAGGIKLKRGVIGNSASGDYYEDVANQKIFMYYAISDEDLFISYERSS